MRRNIFFSLIICFGLFNSWDRLFAQGTWNLSSSTHFLVYYQNAPEKFIEEAKEKAESFYDKIADDLGFRRYDFWLWDKRAKIYIYDTAQAYRQDRQEPEWSYGCAAVEEKTIYTFAYAERFFDSILPHEIGHIIFREFVGFHNPAVPLWLDEAVASYEQDLRSSTDSLIKAALKNKDFIPLDELARFDLSGQSNAGGRVNLFYAESVNLLEFLIKKFGQDSFIEFCRQLRDKHDFQSSLAAVYPYSTLEELGQEWQKHF